MNIARIPMVCFEVATVPEQSFPRKKTKVRLQHESQHVLSNGHSLWPIDEAGLLTNSAPAALPNDNDQNDTPLVHRTQSDVTRVHANAVFGETQSVCFKNTNYRGG